MCGKIGVRLHCFLTDRKQTVSVEGAVTQSPLVNTGVPQDSVLGLLLFLIHIIDINQHVQHSSVASSADDTRVLKEVTSNL